MYDVGVTYLCNICICMKFHIRLRRIKAYDIDIDIEILFFVEYSQTCIQNDTCDELK